MDWLAMLSKGEPPGKSFTSSRRGQAVCKKAEVKTSEKNHTFIPPGKSTGTKA